jgi:hypothetical protein
LHDQPRYNPARRIKIAATVALGRVDEARVELDRMLAVQPGVSIASFRANAARAAAPEYIDAIVAGLREAGLPEGDAA